MIAVFQKQIQGEEPARNEIEKCGNNFIRPSILESDTG